MDQNEADSELSDNEQIDVQNAFADELPLMEDYTPVTESSSYSTSKLTTFTHKWTINHFEMHRTALEEPDEYVQMQSSYFYPPTNHQLKFYISLYPRGDRRCEKSRCFVSAFLSVDFEETNKQHECNQTLMVKMKMSIVKSGEVQLLRECSVKYVRDRNESWGWSEYLSHSKLLSEEMLEANGSLTIQCDVGYITNCRNIALPVNNNLTANYQLAHKKALADISSLLDTGRHSDLIIRVGGIDFALHKNIIYTRCGKLAHHLKIDSSELVELENVQVEVFRVFTKYIYQGTLNENVLTSFASHLLAFSHKYDIYHLKELCTCSLLSQLTVDTVIKLLILADENLCPSLKSACYDCINRHASTIVSNQCKAIQKLISTRSKLYHETLSRIVSKLSQPLVWQPKSAGRLLPHCRSFQYYKLHFLNLCFTCHSQVRANLQLEIYKAHCHFSLVIDNRSRDIARLKLSVYHTAAKATSKGQNKASKKITSKASLTPTASIRASPGTTSTT